MSEQQGRGKARGRGLEGRGQALQGRKPGGNGNGGGQNRPQNVGSQPPVIFFILCSKIYR